MLRRTISKHCCEVIIIVHLSEFLPILEAFFLCCVFVEYVLVLRSPVGAKDFSSILCVQTGSGAHPASCTMDTGGPFPGDKGVAGA
jgi:hypothetical protein